MSLLERDPPGGIDLPIELGFGESLEPQSGEPRRLRELDVRRMATTEPPPVPWRIQDVAADGELTMIYSEPGVGKSMLAAAFGCAVACGESLAGRFTEQGVVMYVDAENGEWETHRRVRSLGVPSKGFHHIQAGDGFDLRKHFDELAQLVSKRRPDLLVLDSLRSLAPGLEENDSAETEAAITPIRRLAQSLGISVLLIHHSKKGGKTYRGSSAIQAAIDGSFHLARADGDDDLQRRYLSCSKMRFAAEPERLWLRFGVEEGLVFVSDAEPIDGADQVAAAPVRQGLIPKLWDLLGQLTTADLARKLGRDPKDQSVRRSLDVMARCGSIERGEDNRWRRVSGVTGPMGADTLTPPVSGTKTAKPEKPLTPLPELYELGSHAVLNLPPSPRKDQVLEVAFQACQGDDREAGLAAVAELHALAQEESPGVRGDES